MSDEVSPESQTSPPPSPGARLLKARELQGKSREHIAGVLNIQLSKLAALEADEYEKLFSPVFTRGYLRSYGKYLGLDGEALVRDFETHYAPTEKQLTQSESLNVKMTNRRSVWPARLGSVALLLLLLVFLFWYFESKKSTPDEQALEPTKSAQNIADAATETDRTQMTGPVADANNGNAVLEQNGLIESAAAELDAASREFVNKSQASNLASDISIGSTSSADGTTLDELVLNFDRECWLEVLDANGDSLAADLQRKGSSITLHGIAPFNVKLGNPSGVEIALNGSDVDVPDAAGIDKVVRFDVSIET